MWLTETIQTVAAPDGADRVMTITSVVMAFLSSMFTGLFAWLNQRDKMKFNADRLRMQAEVENCHKERDEQRLKIANLERQVAELRQIVDAERWRAGGEN